MNSYQPNTILHEVNNLIAYSCHEKTPETERYNTMHSAIIKKHFNAFDVVICHEKKEVNMKIRINKNDFVDINMKCPHLEAFLKSCIEKDPDSLTFYENLLIYYNVVALRN